MKILIATLLALTCLAAAPPVKEFKNPPALKLNPRKLESSIGVCGKNTCEGVKMVSAVVKKGDKYQYTYVLTNYGKKKTWLTGCSVIDVATGYSYVRNDVTQYYKLKPGKSITITVMHESPPVEHLGSVRCLGKRDKVTDAYDKEMGVTVEGATTYSFQMGGLANGYIPKENQPKKGDK